MEILLITIFVAVVVASYLVRIAVLSKGWQKKFCLIMAIAVSVSAGTLAMLAYFGAKGIEYQLGLMVFQLILFSVVIFGIAMLCMLPTYLRSQYLQATPDRMLEILKEAGK